MEMSKLPDEETARRDNKVYAYAPVTSSQRIIEGKQRWSWLVSELVTIWAIAFWLCMVRLE